MCLKPLKIRNPTKTINKQGGQQLVLQVPCNQCAECVQAKRNEWYIRTYYEVQNTLAQGGYVYFDTLTFADNHIPRLSHYIDIGKYGIKDFTCFSHRKYKLFLKRLRRKLAYYYGTNSFKYFLTSEYGEDNRYTHRPHYHILFFVTSKIPPLEFSRIVAESWQYGRTDGILYNSVQYVAGHVYGVNLGYGNNKEFSSVSSICMYVSKYITKSNKFRKTLLIRMNEVRKALLDEDLIKEVVKEIDMFHRQSQGFGYGYLSLMDKRQRDLLADDMISMPDKKKVVKTYPLPMYYKRKLYYTMNKRPDGTRFWQLTSFGVTHVINKRLKSVDIQVVKYMDIINNASSDDRQMFFDYLSGRDISELVVYELFYKGRLRDKGDTWYYKDCKPKYGLTDNEANLYDWLKFIEFSSFSATAPFGDNFLSDDDNVYVIKDYWMRFLNEYEPCIYRVIPKSYLCDNFTFSELSCYEFRDFDKLLLLLDKITKSEKTDKQNTFDYTEEYKQRMKSIK